MTARRLQFASLLAGVFLLLSACNGGGEEPRPTTSAGGSTSAPDPGPGTPVTIKAGDLFLDPTEVTVPPGPVTFTYVNEGAQTHTLVIEGIEGFKLEVKAKGDTASGNVALDRRGRYTMYCDIPGHRAAGMESTLVVR
jgi:plastocyanin